jgi:hypothetical protein
MRLEALPALYVEDWAVENTTARRAPRLSVEKRERHLLQRPRSGFLSRGSSERAHLQLSVTSIIKPALAGAARITLDEKGRGRSRGQRIGRAAAAHFSEVANVQARRCLR